MKKHIITLAALAAMPAVPRAQAPADTLLSRWGRAALENSREIRLGEWETRMAANEKQSVYAVYAPKVESAGMYGAAKAGITADAPTVALPPTGINLFEGSSHFTSGGRGGLFNVGVSQVLFSGLQAPFAIKALENKEAASRIMEEKEKSAVLKDVYLTADNLALVQAADTLLAESRKRLETERRILDGAVKNGLAAPYDRKKIEAAEAVLDAKSTENEGRRQLLLQKLAMLTGLPAAELSARAGALRLSPIVSPAPQGSYTQRPELRALEHARRAADWNYKRESIHFLPRVKAVAGYTFADARNLYLNTPYQTPFTGQPVNLRLNSLTVQPGLYAGVAFSWTLFDLKEQVFGARGAKMEREKIELRTEHAAEMLELAELKAVTESQTAEKLLRAAEKQKAAAESAFRLAEAGYREGLISVSEYLSAEFDLRQAALDHASAVRAQRAARYELLESKALLYPTFQ